MQPLRRIEVLCKETFSRLLKEKSDPADLAGYEKKVFNQRAVLISSLINRISEHRSKSGPGYRCLDIGCNTGYFSAQVAARNIPVVGIDISPEVVARARQDHPGFEVMEGSASDLPVENSTFDSAMSLGVIQVLPDWRDGIREMLRVLKPGGIGVIETNRKQPLFLNFLRLCGSLLKQRRNYKNLWLNFKHTAGLLPMVSDDSPIFFARYLPISEVVSYVKHLGIKEIEVLAPAKLGGLVPTYIFGLVLIKPRT